MNTKHIAVAESHVQAFRKKNPGIDRLSNGPQAVYDLAMHLAEMGYESVVFEMNNISGIWTTGVHFDDGCTLAITELWRTCALDVVSSHRYAGHWRFIYGPSGAIETVFLDGRRAHNPEDITTVVHDATPHRLSLAS